MGCAMHEHQDLNNSGSGSEQIDLSACCNRMTLGGGSPPQSGENLLEMDDKSPPQKMQKISQLKETHSALVKILESAPINRQPQQESKRISDFGSVNSDTQHHHYRKRMKHLNNFSNRSNSNNDNCDNDDDQKVYKLSYTTSGKLENIIVPEQQEQQEQDMECPWKKLNGAVVGAEWQEDNLKNSNEGSLSDNDGDCDDNSSCDCGSNNIMSWRRTSSDSSDSVQNDSGCDSDCLDNASDTCKNLNENHQENNVNIFMNMIISNR